ncbi:hypothetical protein ABMA28_005561 [Loxostege sticticalis]|uniref:Odorant receptor n=1 Tax=Loxostege sticticalis TaxID=481309 RepID=A0ABD0SM39_LOXSC
MDVPKNLKETHPQRYYLKKMCKWTYYMGIGDCWYEETKRSKTHKILYALWATFINSYIILGTVNELLANFRSDVTPQEKNDLIQFSFAHPSLCAKYIFLILQKDRVKKLFKRMVGEKRVFTSLEVEKQSVREAFIYSVSLAIVTYGTLTMTVIDAFKRYIKEGVPFQTEVALLPSPSYSGLFSGVLKVFKELHWWAIVSNMLLVDGLSFFSLVFLGYKFKLVRIYFESLREKVLRNADNKSKEALAEEFQKDFVTGVKLHEDALWCARNVQYALGNIYGVEIIETSTCMVILLIKIVDSGRNMTFLLANLFFFSCLFMINGAYMMAAGDVTYEASLLSTSMFHCGWELVRVGRGFRTLAVVAIQRSQRPVHMTAFGVITLSHGNLISVVRSSYSFFAVMY